MSSFRYADKVAIITGASRGIGKGCSEQFVRAGAQVIVCSNDHVEGEAVAAELAGVASEQGAGGASFVYCDVTQSEDIARLIEVAVDRYGQIDCLINNAGWHPPHKPIDDFSAEEFRELLELNVVSIFNACKTALPYLRQTRGNIINIASLVGIMGQQQATTYVATKGAVAAFTRALAIDEAPNGVRVNSVSPGNIMTPMWREAMDVALDPAKHLAAGEAAQHLGRLGTPEEVGRLCLFIAAEATFTTGVDHIISGGAELGYGAKSQCKT